MRVVSLTVVASFCFLGACSNSRSLEAGEEQMDFLYRTTYVPESVADVAGCYTSASGFGGKMLALREDSTYFHNAWTDLFDPEDPIQGQEGDFRLFGDVAALRFRALVLNATVTDSAEQARQDAVSARHADRTQVYRFKVIDDTLFAVPPRMEGFFAQAALEGGGTPSYTELGGRRHSTFFLARSDPALCER